MLQIAPDKTVQVLLCGTDTLGQCRQFSARMMDLEAPRKGGQIAVPFSLLPPGGAGQGSSQKFELP